MLTPEAQRRWKSRARAWRMTMVLCLVMPLPVLPRLVARNDATLFGAGVILTGFIMLAVMASAFAEKAQDRATLPDADRLILGRFRRSSIRLVAIVIGLGCLIPFCFEYLRSQQHFSIAEAFVTVSLPYWLVCGVLRKRLGISAGSDTETIRAHALLIDRDRQQFAWAYAGFAIMWLLEIGTWLPQVLRALHGQTVNLGQLHVFGVFAVTSLLMLYGPRRIFDSRIFAAIAEDESLTTYRDQAFRYGFFTLALGMIVSFDLALRNPRLALVMLPVLFAASQIIGFLTLAIQEFRAGRVGDTDDGSSASGRLDFRGSAGWHGG